MAFDGRHKRNPDGLNYLDVASTAVSGGSAKLLNGNWSPALPALVAVAVVQPSPSQELSLVHAVQLGCLRPVYFPRLVLQELGVICAQGP